MRIRRPRISLLTLLLLPAMFAAGWWARGIRYERDVYIAAEYMAMDSGGIFIPEIGLFRGGKKLSQSLNSLPPEAGEELNRRIEYLDRTSQYYDDSMIPEQRSLLSVLISGATGKSSQPSVATESCRTAVGTLDSLGPSGSIDIESKDAVAQKQRAAFFERLRRTDQ